VSQLVFLCWATSSSTIDWGTYNIACVSRRTLKFMQRVCSLFFTAFPAEIVKGMVAWGLPTSRHSLALEKFCGSVLPGAYFAKLFWTKNVCPPPHFMHFSLVFLELLLSVVQLLFELHLKLSSGCLLLTIYQHTRRMINAS